MDLLNLRDPIEHGGHLRVGEDGRAALLQRHLVVRDQAAEAVQVVVLALHEAVDDEPPLGLVRGHQLRRRRQRGRRGHGRGGERAEQRLVLLLQRLHQLGVGPLVEGGRLRGSPQREYPRQPRAGARAGGGHLRPRGQPGDGGRVPGGGGGGVMVPGLLHLRHPGQRGWPAPVGLRGGPGRGVRRRLLARGELLVGGGPPVPGPCPRVADPVPEGPRPQEAQTATLITPETGGGIGQEIKTSINNGADTLNPRSS